MLIAKTVRFLSMLLFAVTGTANVHAGVVTFDFNDLLGRVVHANYYQDGFRFSPNCHYDAGFVLGADNWLGWDSAGCERNDVPGAPPGFVGSNPDWLGPPELSPNTNGFTGYYYSPSLMYIDFSGQNFSLLSTDVIGGESLRFWSSKGGIFDSGRASGAVNVAFDGGDWRGIDWLLISGGGGFPLGIDNLVVRAIPEPATVALVSAALLGVVATRRRRIASALQ